MFFNNLLKEKAFYKKGRLTAIWPQAAPRLACREFSQSNAQGYPQEWWITHTGPQTAGVGKKRCLAYQ
ncbi:hypothetical protein C1N62_11640 [Nissabacter sp. SGAir0207]|nr:hypothetical protein C1N62_11640 [Nissabacter sp. SGAir0207]